jgi:hypothetical protein
LAQESPSLADIAKKEESRRATVAKSARVYSNKDLTPAPASSPAVAAPGTPASGNATPTVSVDATAAPPEEEEKLDEKFWRSRAAGHRLNVQRAKDKVADYSVADTNPDPRERAMLANVLKTAQEVLARAEQSYASFLKEADAKKVPRDWVLP